MKKIIFLLIIFSLVGCIKDKSPKSTEYYNITYNESTINTCKHNWEYGVWIITYDEGAFKRGQIKMQQNRFGGNHRYLPAQFCTKCGVLRLAPKELNQTKY